MTLFSHPACYILLLCFISTLFFVCCRSAGEEVDLTGPDTNLLGLSLGTQRPTNLLYLILPLLLTLCFQLSAPLSCFLFLPLVFSFPPLSVPSPPSFPHCPSVSVLAWVIDSCKGWLRLPPSFRFSLQLLLLSSPAFFSLSASSPLLSLLLFFFLLNLTFCFLLVFCFWSFHPCPSLSGRLNFRLKLSLYCLVLCLPPLLYLDLECAE